MTSSVVAIGSNQVWSFTPSIDLLDERDTGRLCTPKLVPPAAATPAAAPAAPPKSSIDAMMAKFGLATVGSGARAAPVAAPPATPTVNPHAVSSLNLLIVEAGDILHALKTIIMQHRHIKDGEAPPPTHFYVLDGESSATARHLLLLAIALDTSLSLRGRTELFLEVYGNALIQEKTQLYINRKVKEIRSYLSSLSSLSSSSSPSPLGQSLFRGLVDLSHLKNKEIDQVESALDFCTTPNTRPSQKRIKGDGTTGGDEEEPEPKEKPPADVLARVLPQKEPNVFDIETLRDHRLRGYFGDRFDARANLVDWDYHMRLKAVASIIHVIHYKQWRLTGLAFEERLCTYTYPNRTLASYREAKSKSRGSVSVRGYWGDTLVSPYISLGVEANDRRLFQRKNRQHVKTSPHICEYNLLSLLYELETGTPYALPGSDSKKKKAKSGAKNDEDEEIVQLPDEVDITGTASASSSSSAPITIIEETDDTDDAASSSDAPARLCHTTEKALSLAHVRINFLNGEVKLLANKRRYASLFDRVFLSQFEVGCINEAAAAHAAAEAKAKQAKTEKSETDTAAATATPTPPPSLTAADRAALPLNQLLKPNSVITVETVKFLPVTPDVKAAYVRSVTDLATSAGWRAAEPAASAWTPSGHHSWSSRDVEQPSEEAEKREALTAPARINFTYAGDKTQ